MGGKASRDKGQRGEREVCQLLGDLLGVDLSRTLDQTRDGGADIVWELWAIEVKRRIKYTQGDVMKWWDQACQQAKTLGKHPVLLYRADREEWECLMPYSLEENPSLYYVHGDMKLLVSRIRND
jgi:hypothetical protein